MRLRSRQARRFRYNAAAPPGRADYFSSSDGGLPIASGSKSLEQRTNKLSGLIGAIWATVGFSLILLDAINRLSRIALEALDAGMTPLLWAVFIAVIIFMGYAEGYRGFQKSFLRA